MEQQATWIRVAGNAGNIKSGHPHGWRCFFKGNPAEIPLRDWHTDGESNQKNFIPGFSGAKDEYGLVAWIDCFGSYTIKDDVLYIVLQQPKARQ